MNYNTYMDSPNYKLAHYGLHFFEEPCISGEKGSGTIFFSGCNMRCVYCQNFQISQQCKGTVVSEDTFLELCRRLESFGAHNINLVTPTHYVKCLCQTLPKLRKITSLPIVYNTSGYENPDDLRRLEGLVDVYLTDMRYFSNEWAEKYSNAPNYFERASRSLCEMLRQQSSNEYDEKGLLKRGVIVRLLILPSHKSDVEKTLDYLATLGGKITISLMAQYFPTYRSCDFPEINRRITRREYDSLCRYAFDLGFTDGFSQELSSSKAEYVPRFNLIEENEFSSIPLQRNKKPL